MENTEKYNRIIHTIHILKNQNAENVENALTKRIDDTQIYIRTLQSIASRHTCPGVSTKMFFPIYRYGGPSPFEYVGRCDREQKCGYHLTPKTYFEQNPEQCEQTQVRERPFRPALPPSPTSYVDEALVKQSMSHYKENKLFQFLLSQFGEDESLRLMKLYRIGTANHWQGSTVFWQTDIQGKVRTGKIMLYNPANGRRIKEPHNHITWVHSLIHKDDFTLKQCFFGEHLLTKDSTKSVAIVESERVP